MPLLPRRRSKNSPDTTSPPSRTRVREGGKRKVSSFEDVVDSAVTIPSHRVHAYVDKLRLKNPKASPEQIIEILERRYLLAVSTSGGAVGAAAAIPVVGTGTALVLTAGQVGTFLAASSALALAVADVHGIEVTDGPRRRALLLASLLGEKGPQILEQQLGLSTVTWGRALLTRLPLATVKTVNRTLRGRVIKGTAAKAGSIMLGRLMPFGVGAMVGYTGGRVMGNSMIKGTREAFGAPPLHFTRHVDATFTVIEPDLFADPFGTEGAPSPKG